MFAHHLVRALRDLLARGPLARDRAPRLVGDPFAAAMQLPAATRAAGASYAAHWRPTTRMEPEPADEPLCGRCHVMPAEPGEAWCETCLGEESYDDYVLGTHVSQLDPAEVRHTGCRCPSGGLHGAGCPTLTGGRDAGELLHLDSPGADTSTTEPF